MHCFGAPVFAAGRHEAVAAVAVSLIKASTSPRRRDEVIDAIRLLAASVSERLGFEPMSAAPARAIRRRPGP
jgi:DNA-binding IclR family transcriptional regulator